MGDETLKLLGYMSRRDLTYLSVGIILSLISCYVALLIPDCISHVTRILGNGSASMDEVYSIARDIVIYAAVAFVSGTSTYILFEIAASHLSSNLRKAVFVKIMSFTDRDISRFDHASLLMRTTNDVSQVEHTFSDTIPLILQSLAMAIFAILAVWHMGWHWVVIISAITESVICMFLLTVTLAAPRYGSIQRALDKVSSVINENINGIRSIRAFHGEEYRSKEFSRKNENLMKENLGVARITTVVEPYTAAMLSLLTLFIYVIAAILMFSAEIADRTSVFYDTIIVSTYGAIVVSSAIAIVNVVMKVPRILTSKNRIAEIIDLESTASEGNANLDDKVDILEVDNVSFRYDGADSDTVHNVSFQVSKGELVALIGGTGSGKSTMLNLISHLDTPTGGTIRLNGVDINTMDPDEYHALLGYATQKPIFFRGTVDHNVRFGEIGSNCSMVDLKDALSLSHSEEFVSKMENGTDHLIHTGGSNLSGGQRQRLSIARSVVARPEIYLFDDTFSALDNTTESEIRRDISDEFSDSMIILVTQKVSSASVADRVVFMDHGVVLGIGTHDELMSNCEEYRRLAEIQGA